jgi:hypothetical protein
MSENSFLFIDVVCIDTTSLIGWVMNVQQWVG